MDWENTNYALGFLMLQEWTQKSADLVHTLTQAYHSLNTFMEKPTLVRSFKQRIDNCS